MSFTGGRGAEKALENARQVVFGYAHAFIVKTNLEVGICGKGDTNLCCRRRVLDGVVHEDQKQLPQKCGVTVEKHIAFELALDLNMLLIGERRRQRARFIEDLFEVQRFGRNAKLPGIGHRKCEQTLDDST